MSLLIEFTEYKTSTQHIRALARTITYTGCGGYRGLCATNPSVETSESPHAHARWCHFLTGNHSWGSKYACPKIRSEVKENKMLFTSRVSSLMSVCNGIPDASVTSCIRDFVYRTGTRTNSSVSLSLSFRLGSRGNCWHTARDVVA
jgi:hypothetical protein